MPLWFPVPDQAKFSLPLLPRESGKFKMSSLHVHSGQSAHLTVHSSSQFVDIRNAERQLVRPSISGSRILGT